MFYRDATTSTHFQRAFLEKRSSAFFCSHTMKRYRTEIVFINGINNFCVFTCKICLKIGLASETCRNELQMGRRACASNWYSYFAQLHTKWGRKSSEIVFQVTKQIKRILEPSIYRYPANKCKGIGGIWRQYSKNFPAEIFSLGQKVVKIDPFKKEVGIYYWYLQFALAIGNF